VEEARVICYICCIGRFITAAGKSRTTPGFHLNISKNMVAN